MARNSTAAAARVSWPEGRRQARRRPQRRQDRSSRVRGAAGTPAAARIAVTAAVVAASLLVLGIRQAGITAVGYEIDAAKRQLSEARAELKRLEAQLALLAAPGRVEDGALAMGMTNAAEVRLASVEPLVAEEAGAVEARTVVIQLPPAAPGDSQHARGETEAGDVALESRTLAEAVGDLLMGWLGGRRAEAEALH